MTKYNFSIFCIVLFGAHGLPALGFYLWLSGRFWLYWLLAPYTLGVVLAAVIGVIIGIRVVIRCLVGRYKNEGSV